MCCIYHCHVYCHPIDWFICFFLFFVFYVWKLFRFKLFQHFRILFSLWLLFSYFSFIPSFVNLVYFFFSSLFNVCGSVYLLTRCVFPLSIYFFIIIIPFRISFTSTRSNFILFFWLFYFSLQLNRHIK